jgi:hypothetical protein
MSNAIYVEVGGTETSGLKLMKKVEEKLSQMKRNLSVQKSYL